MTIAKQEVLDWLKHRVGDKELPQTPIPYVRKTFAASLKQIDPENHTLTARVNTVELDRDQEIILPSGWKRRLKFYRDNPIILFGHNYRDLEAIIAKSLREEIIEREGLEMELQYAVEESPWAALAFRLVIGGYLNAFSVGFIPWASVEDQEEMDRVLQAEGIELPKNQRLSLRRIWTDVELLEASQVSVPTNRTSLVQSRAKGLFDGDEKVLELVDRWIEGWDEHTLGEEVLMSLKPPQKAEHEWRVGGARDLPLAPLERPWDAAAAEGRVRRWASKDGSGNKDQIDWPKYRKAFVVYDAGNQEAIGGYKLQFADVIDGKLTAVPRGLFAIAVVLQGGRGGVDLPEAVIANVKKFVGHYYERMDRTPPWEQEGFDPGQEYWKLYPDLETGTVEKVGAVLNAKNKERLKQAQALIQQVLDSAEHPPEEEGRTGEETASGGAEPPGVRELVASMLEPFQGLEAKVDELLDLLKNGKPDEIVLDITDEVLDPDELALDIAEGIQKGLRKAMGRVD